MKQILLVAFIVVSFSSFGQIPAGTRTYGGNVSFYLSKTEYPYSTSRDVSLYINPRFGKAVKENVVKGFGFSYEIQQRNATGNALSTTHNAGIEMFKQRYMPLGNSFMVFGEGNIGAGFGYNKNYTKSATISAGLGAGLAYNANKKLMFTLSFPEAVSAFVGYNETKYNSGLDIIKNTGYSAGLRSTVALNNLQFGVVLLH